MSSPSATSESALLAACMSYLHATRIMAWRQNQGAMKVNGRFIRFASVKGISDIIGVLPDGRFLAVECKIGNKKPTDQQAEFIADVRDNHGVAFVARSIEDIERELIEAGVALAL